MAGLDPGTEVPPLGLIPLRQQWRAPFIYSPADIEALMTQARAMRWRLPAATHETLIGLLAATGLRVGEALRLDRGDVDTTGGVLKIRESKFGKSRLVPLHPSTMAALAEFARLRDEHQQRPKEASFFVSLTGKRLIYAVVGQTFRRLVDDAGVDRDHEVAALLEGREPRVHEHF